MAGLLVFQVGSDWSLLLATRVRSSSYGVAAVSSLNLLLVSWLYTSSPN
jgi:hypothetical protein